MVGARNVICRIFSRKEKWHIGEMGYCLLAMDLKSWDLVTKSLCGILTVGNGLGLLPGYETNVCVDCGYFENYVLDEDTLQDVIRNWTRVT